MCLLTLFLTPFLYFLLAKRKYEMQFHNKLRNMKSENCKDYSAVLNEHSSNDPHKFVINLDVFKKNFRKYKPKPS